MGIIPQRLLDHRLLTDNDRQVLIRPAGIVYQRNCLMLLEGLLASRGGTHLSEAKSAAIQGIGVCAGRTILSELLADNTKTATHPERVLHAHEAEPFYARITRWKDDTTPDPRPALTCEKILVYLGKVRAELQRRKDAEAFERQITNKQN